VQINRDCQLKNPKPKKFIIGIQGMTITLSRGSMPIPIGLTWVALGFRGTRIPSSGYVARKIRLIKMATNLDLKVNEAWNNALRNWNYPSIPRLVTVKSKSEINNLGKDVAPYLQKELAFMKFPQFQIYANLENIAEKFPENPERGLNVILNHEVGHRFCPYDTITLILLQHAVKKELQGEKLPYSLDGAAPIIMNLFTDTCVNTFSVKKDNKDLPWAYSQLSQREENRKSRLWHVYAKSKELIWSEAILPDDVKLKKEELEAAEKIAGLFTSDFFDSFKWNKRIRAYARIISKFLDNEAGDKGSSLDNIAGNIPKNIDEKTAEELAKRLSEIGKDGLPTNSSGLKEFKDIMAGFGHGDEKKASIIFYDMLSNSYSVMFTTKPFGKPKINPFQPIKWTPSMSVEKLDVNYSVQVGGRIIPGVNSYAWNTRKRDLRGGFEEVIPNLDLYLDSSGSMPDPTQTISLSVLAGFVVAKKAHSKGASIRVTNFSGNGQHKTQEFTRDLAKIYDVLVVHYNGGTVFPVKELLKASNPRQVLAITDTFIGNEKEVSEAILEFIRRHKDNKFSVYALKQAESDSYLKRAGAEIIYGTTAEIFKKVIGKAEEVYSG